MQPFSDKSIICANCGAETAAEPRWRLRQLGGAPTLWALDTRRQLGWGPLYWFTVPDLELLLQIVPVALAGALAVARRMEAFERAGEEAQR